jgi:toxin YoeB
MKIVWTKQAAQDLEHWKQKDRAKIKRISLLLKSIQETPFSGLGKPEGLKFTLAGLWSRRINEEHRLVYKVEHDRITVLSCRYHY